MSEPDPPQPVLAPLQGLPPKVSKALEYVRDLWSIPRTTDRLLQRLQAADCKLEVIVRDVEKDPGLTFQLLRVVNSSFYALDQKVTSVDRAISLLGYSTTKQIVLVHSLVSRAGHARAGVDFDLKAFWRHSLQVGHAASLFCRAPRSAFPDEFFTAGLLHDIGKLIEYQYLKSAFHEILEAVKKGESFPSAEQRILGTTHAAIGAAVCDSWGFPPLIIQAVRHHLDPPFVASGPDVSHGARVIAAVCGYSGRFSDEERKDWLALLNESPQRMEEIEAEAMNLTVLSMQNIFSF